MSKRLDEDHKNALYLGKEMSKIDGVNVDLENLKINMVFFEIDNTVISDEDFSKKLLDNNILINSTEYGKGRLVTHNGITREDIEYFLETVKKILI
jgi:threonine aldolase